MRRTFGDQLDSGREPPPVVNLPTIEERDEPGRGAVRKLQLHDDSDGPSSSSNESTKQTPPSVHNVIYACSDGDYLRLMALVFQKVFRE